MKHLKKLSILALLLTAAVQGVWAQEVYVYAEDVFYPEISADGKTMTIKCGDITSEDAYYYREQYNDWGNSHSDTFNHEEITSVVIDASCRDAAATTLNGFFLGFENLTEITGLSNINTANVTDMSSMFTACFALTSLDLSGFNTAKVTNMLGMFSNCSSLKTITVGDGWTTDAVTESDGMFNNCTSLPNFDSDKTDKTNAHTGQGGYLTAAAPPVDIDWNATTKTGTFTMPAGNVELQVEYEPEYSATFKALTANTIGTKATVKLDNVAIDTLSAEKNTLNGIYPGQTVTLTAQQGYKFRKVEAKAGAAKVEITIGDVTLDITGCTTWEDIVNQNSDKIGVDKNGYVYRKDDEAALYDGENLVVKSRTYYANDGYSWVQ